MSTPDDMVLNHLNLKSVEVATPSLRHWDLIGWDLDCCNREVSIGAIKHLGKAFWNDCSNVNFESLLVQFGLEVLNVWEPFCEKSGRKKKWRFASCPTASDFILSSLSWAMGSWSSFRRSKPKATKTTETGDPGFVQDAPSKVGYRRRCKHAVSSTPSQFKLRLSLSVGGWKLETKRIWVRPESGLALLGVWLKTVDAKHCF